MRMAHEGVVHDADATPIAEQSLTVPEPVCSPTEQDWKLVESVDEKVLLRTAKIYTNDADLAWQLVQEARVRAARSMKSVEKREDPNSIRSYLIKTTRNVALEWIRREKNGPVVFSSQALAEGRKSDEVADVSETTFSAADLQCAQEIYDSLPPKGREVFRLRYYEELDYAEIAARLGIPVSTVRSHVRHIVNQTRRLSVGRGEAS